MYIPGRFPAVHTSYTSQNFRLFHASNLSVQNYVIFCSCNRGSCGGRRPRHISAAAGQTASATGDGRSMCEAPRRHRHWCVRSEPGDGGGAAAGRRPRPADEAGGGDRAGV